MRKLLSLPVLLLAVVFALQAYADRPIPGDMNDDRNRPAKEDSAQDKSLPDKDKPSDSATREKEEQEKCVREATEIRGRCEGAVKALVGNPECQEKKLEGSVSEASQKSMLIFHDGPIASMKAPLVARKTEGNSIADAGESFRAKCAPIKEKCESVCREEVAAAASLRARYKCNEAAALPPYLLGKRRSCIGEIAKRMGVGEKTISHGQDLRDEAERGLANVGDSNPDKESDKDRKIRELQDHWNRESSDTAFAQAANSNEMGLTMPSSQPNAIGPETSIFSQDRIMQGKPELAPMLEVSYGGDPSDMTSMADPAAPPMTLGSEAPDSSKFSQTTAPSPSTDIAPGSMMASDTDRLPVLAAMPDNAHLSPSLSNSALVYSTAPVPEYTFSQPRGTSSVPEVASTADRTTSPQPSATPENASTSNRTSPTEPKEEAPKSSSSQEAPASSMAALPSGSASPTSGNSQQPTMSPTSGSPSVSSLSQAAPIPSDKVTEASVVSTGDPKEEKDKKLKVADAGPKFQQVEMQSGLPSIGGDLETSKSNSSGSVFLGGPTFRDSTSSNIDSSSAASAHGRYGKSKALNFSGTSVSSLSSSSRGSRSHSSKAWWRPSIFDRMFGDSTSSSEDSAANPVDLSRFLPKENHQEDAPRAQLRKEHALHGSETVIWHAISGRYHSLETTLLENELTTVARPPSNAAKNSRGPASHP